MDFRHLAVHCNIAVQRLGAVSQACLHTVEDMSAGWGHHIVVEASQPVAFVVALAVALDKRVVWASDYCMWAAVLEDTFVHQLLETCRLLRA